MECNAPKDSGWGCGYNVQRWHYDNVAHRCLSFIYSGCGGNLNNFETLRQCQFCMPGRLNKMLTFSVKFGVGPNSCSLAFFRIYSRPCSFTADYGPCSDDSSYLPNATGNCAGRGPNATPCPAGYTCSMGAFFGVCCNTTTERALFKFFLILNLLQQLP